jgi:hypothetical protein
MSVLTIEHHQVRQARRLEAEISELAGHLASATCRFLLMIAEFDRLDGWVGHRSCAQWLSWRCALSPAAAREHVRVGHALEKYAVIREAFAAGRLSYSKVRAITRVADHSDEAELVQTALVTTAAQLERIVRAMRRATRPEVAERHMRRTLSWHWDDDGMLVLYARLAPEEGAVTLAALNAARSTGPTNPRGAASANAREDTATNARDDTAANVRDDTDANARDDTATNARDDLARNAPDDDAAANALGDASAETREAQPDAHPSAGSRTNRDALAAPATTLADPPITLGDPPITLADAFSAIMTSYLDSGARDSADAEAFQIVVLTNASTLAPEAAAPTASGLTTADGADDGRPGGVTDQGIALPRDTVLRLACTAVATNAVIGTDGTPMDIGRKTRRLNASLRRALRLRDARCCGFPGCTARRRLHAHHIRHWAHGGGTTLANLISLCPAHHWAVHEGGHRVHVDDTGRLRVIGPDGRTIDPAPPIGPGNADLLPTNGQITPDTIGPGWDGSPLDLDNAVFALLQPTLGNDDGRGPSASGQSAA